MSYCYIVYLHYGRIHGTIAEHLPKRVVSRRCDWTGPIAGNLASVLFDDIAAELPHCKAPCLHIVWWQCRRPFASIFWQVSINVTKRQTSKSIKFLLSILLSFFYFPSSHISALWYFFSIIPFLPESHVVSPSSFNLDSLAAGNADSSAIVDRHDPLPYSMVQYIERNAAHLHGCRFVGMRLVGDAK